jgi:DNA-binding transcriptional ArsR family regulator
MLLEDSLVDRSRIERKLADLKQEISALEKLNKFLEMKVLHMTQTEESPSLWLKIENRKTIMSIVSAYSDPQKKEILDAITEKPLTILEVVERTSLPQTTAYRKINELINSNLIKSTGLFLNKDSKRVHAYTTTIKHMRIYFEENDILMFLILDNATIDFVEKSKTAQISKN